MILQRLNVLHWPLRFKLAFIFMLAIALPSLIIIVPYTNQRGTSLLNEQHKTRMETLGPFLVARTEQTFQTLTSGLEQRLDNPAFSEPIQLILHRITNAADERQRNSSRTTAQAYLIAMLHDIPSISGLRYYDSAGALLIDLQQIEGTIDIKTGDTVNANTPGEVLIRQSQVSSTAVISDIYQEGAGNPALDIILPIRPTWDVEARNTPSGFVVFTQNLENRAETDGLPNLYNVLEKFPEGSQKTYVYVLNDDSQLLTTSEDIAPLTFIQRSTGFQNALRQGSNITTYDSPVLNEEVLGYAHTVDFANGPQWVYMIEIPTAEIRQESTSESMLTGAVIITVMMFIGMLAVTVGTVVIIRPITRLTTVTQAIAEGRLDTQLPEFSRRDEVGSLYESFGMMTSQITDMINQLESRVTERTRNLETILAVSRVIASIRDQDTLLETIVNHIRDHFDTIYHAQIFLVDPNANQANLRASTGAIGQQLLERKHALMVGSQSVIGQVTATGNPVIALDTSNNPVHRRNEFLPDTRAEMALPLRLNERVIGALDLQSRHSGAFTPQDIELFQGMADQISIALENAQLFAESNTQLRQIETLNRTLASTAWRELGDQHKYQPRVTGQAELTNEIQWSNLQLQAIKTGQLVEHVGQDNVTFAIPVTLRGQSLGAIEWEIARTRYTSEVRQMAHELANTLALTAENIRLFEQSREVAEREQLVNQISHKLTSTTEIDEILRIAVRELGTALRLPQTAIHLKRPATDSNNNHSDE